MTAISGTASTPLTTALDPIKALYWSAVTLSATPPSVARAIVP